MSDSNGHACVLQYILLHLLGYDITLDDLKNFRVSHILSSLFTYNMTAADNAWFSD